MFLCVGIQFNMVPSGVVAIAENRAERWAVAGGLLLHADSRDVPAHNAASQKVRLPSFDNRSLLHLVRVPADSSVSDDMAAGASIRVARLNTWTDMDMQMELGGVLCEPDKLRSARMPPSNHNDERIGRRVQRAVQSERTCATIGTLVSRQPRHWHTNWCTNCSHYHFVCGHAVRLHSHAAVSPVHIVE